MTYFPQQRAFTLIELLVVVAIIGLLSSVVMASLNAARDKALDSRRLSDIRQVQTALELYAGDNQGRYPITGSSYLNSTAGLLAPSYIRVVPDDPKNIAPYTYRYYTDDGLGYSILIDLKRDGANNFCGIHYGTPYSSWLPPTYPLCY